MKVKFLLLSIFIISVASCAQFKRTEIGCHLVGGDRIQTMIGHVCAKKYPDGGKACTDSIQCKGSCLAGNEIKKVGIKTIGYCQYNNYFANGQCFTVEKGISKFAGCVEE